MKLTVLWLFALIVIGCSNQKLSESKNPIASSWKDARLDTVVFFDSIRQREIPVAFYHGQNIPTNKKSPLVLFSHGYGENQPGSYLAYDYLNSFLAESGYVVASIQHELPTDPLLNREGNAMVVRMPNWERGVENLSYVLREIEARYSNIDTKHLTAIGHSNGGDMSVLFCHKFPDKVEKLITLDHRRMPLLRSNSPKQYSLRSSDQVADPNVIPDSLEQSTFNIRIVQLADIRHNDMDNDATEAQRKTILQYISEWLPIQSAQ